jgi:hypothetical protein
VLFLSSIPPEFIPVGTETAPTPRFEHTAHQIGDKNSLILVGGRLDDRLNGVIELLELHVTKSEEGIKALATTSTLGQLKFPRHQHASLLFQDSEQPLLQIYGGFGGSLGTPHVPLTAESCRVLDAPEAFRIRTSPGYAHPLLLAPGADLPGPRRGLHMISLDDPTGQQKNRALLVGGTRREATTDAFSPTHITECRIGYAVRAEDLGRGRIQLQWTPAGRLPVEMFQPSIAVIPGGRILIVGGLEKDGRPTAEAAIFDPVSGILERVCKAMSIPGDDSGPLMASRAVSLWGGAMILGTSPDHQISRAILFQLGN